MTKQFTPESFDTPPSIGIASEKRNFNASSLLEQGHQNGIFAQLQKPNLVSEDGNQLVIPSAFGAQEMPMRASSKRPEPEDGQKDLKESRHWMKEAQHELSTAQKDFASGNFAAGEAALKHARKDMKLAQDEAEDSQKDFRKERHEKDDDHDGDDHHEHHHRHHPKHKPGQPGHPTGDPGDHPPTGDPGDHPPTGNPGDHPPTGNPGDHPPPVTNPHTGKPYAHVVYVMLENHNLTDIQGNSQAPFLNSLAQNGKLLTNATSEEHGSESNYIAGAGGSTFGVPGDKRIVLNQPSIFGQYEASGQTAANYFENGAAVRHEPYTNFKDALGVGQNMSNFPTDFSNLPNFSWITPNLDHNMHNGTVGQADAWLQQTLGAYAKYAEDPKNNSLLVITTDEPRLNLPNSVPVWTSFTGAGVTAGQVDNTAYNNVQVRILHALEQNQGFTSLGDADGTVPI